jgi:hypothetical protein
MEVLYNYAVRGNVVVGLEYDETEESWDKAA